MFVGLLSAALLVLGAGHALVATQVSADEGCRYSTRGPHTFSMEGYPGPKLEEFTFEVGAGNTAVVELYRTLRHSEPEHVFVPVRSAESGNRRFMVLNGWWDIQWLVVHDFTASCTYPDVMLTMGKYTVYFKEKARWTLPWDRIGLVQPDVPGEPLPIAAPDPLYQCGAVGGSEWKLVTPGTWIGHHPNLDLQWEVEVDGVTSAFGEYPGWIIAPAKRKIYLRTFEGVCAPGRWWEPFAFERIVTRARNRSEAAPAVQFDPRQFVSDGRLFMPLAFTARDVFAPPAPTLRP